jgi:hypothetical protein
MRLLKTSVLATLAIATAVAIATPAYAAKSLDDAAPDTGIVAVETDEAVVLKTAPEIDRENAEFIADQRSAITRGDSTELSREDDLSSLTIKDLGALDRVSANLDNRVGNVVKTAIEERKVSKDLGE